MAALLHLVMPMLKTERMALFPLVEVMMTSRATILAQVAAILVVEKEMAELPSAVLLMENRSPTVRLSEMARFVNGGVTTVESSIKVFASFILVCHVNVVFSSQSSFYQFVYFFLA